MAHVITTAPRHGLVETARASFAAAARALADWQLYRSTLAELDALSERELRDLRIARSSIRQIAYDAVYAD